MHRLVRPARFHRLYRQHHMLKKLRFFVIPYFTDCFPCCSKSHQIDPLLVRRRHDAIAAQCSPTNGVQCSGGSFGRGRGHSNHRNFVWVLVGDARTEHAERIVNLPEPFAMSKPFLGKIKESQDAFRTRRLPAQC
jgi:hypothetical protein